MAKKEKKQKEQTVAELRLELDKIKEELLTLRLDKSIGKLKNTKSLFHKRKEIARILTYLKQKEVIAKA